MATTVYTTEEVELQDGTTVLLRPLPIKTLRKFMKIMEAFGTAQSEEEGLDVISDASATALSKARPEFYDKTKKDGLGGSSEEWEEVADIETIYKILEVCGGIKLNDPNLLAQAQAALLAEDGEN